MKTRVTIQDGEFTMDALDGVGQQCRAEHASYIARLQREFGLDPSEFKEDCKPEMNQLQTDQQTQEGDKLV